MAQRVITKISSDLSGNDDAETITFSYQGTTYEIDLTKDEQGDLIKALEPYTSNARKTGSTARRSRTATGSGKRSDLAAIRSWARENGWPKLSDRGRIPSNIVEAYDAAH